jgi:ribonucleoside-diphosphate reductase alpha chain
MCGQAYLTSARVAEVTGAFPGYERNREPFLEVIRMHRDASRKISGALIEEPLHQAAQSCWDDAYEMGRLHGYRNGQVTVIAPTGTIGFMMDCDTTGVEPDIALVKYKKLVGGGLMKIVNNTVPAALARLGYSPAEIKDIVDYIDEHEMIEGAPHLKDRDLPVFDCAFKPARGVRSIHYMGHIKMMGAVQPFISGAISKTVNVPKAATVEEIEQAYIDAWRIGAKAVSIYRDGSKRTQPLNTAKDKAAVAADVPAAGPRRRRLPDERQSITHKFDIGGHEGYITVGLYEDGQPGELFLTMAKEGSTISGFADAFAQAISYALQYGVPLQDLVDKFSHVRFEPSGMTRNADIRFAKSIVDYIFRWMAVKFLSPEAQYRAGVNNREEAARPEQLVLEVTTSAAPTAASASQAARTVPAASFAAIQNQEDAPPCSTCGSIMVRSGACYKCTNCGTTSGCA